jgi:hypothetical protein
MLIEASKVNPDREFYGKDLDPRCAKMCALNMLFFNLNAVVEWGNTLAFTTHTRWVIRKGGFIWEIEPKEEQRIEPVQGALPLAA